MRENKRVNARTQKQQTLTSSQEIPENPLRFLRHRALRDFTGSTFPPSGRRLCLRLPRPDAASRPSVPWGAKGKQHSGPALKVSVPSIYLFSLWAVFLTFWQHPKVYFISKKVFNSENKPDESVFSRKALKFELTGAEGIETPLQLILKCVRRSELINWL